MSRKTLLATSAAALLFGSAFIAAQAAKAPAGSGTTRPARLTKPWSELKDLSDEQVTKIHAVHEKFLEQRHELEVKEKAEITALLTDAQKKELEQVAVDDKKEAAERRASGHEKTGTTRPASEK